MHAVNDPTVQDVMQSPGAIEISPVSFSDVILQFFFWFSILPGAEHSGAEEFNSVPLCPR